MIIDVSKSQATLVTMTTLTYNAITKKQNTYKYIN